MAEHGLITRISGDRYPVPRAPNRSQGAAHRPSGPPRKGKPGTLEGVLTVNVRGFGFVVTPERRRPTCSSRPGYFGRRAARRPRARARQAGPQGPRRPRQSRCSSARCVTSAGSSTSPATTPGSSPTTSACACRSGSRASCRRRRARAWARSPRCCRLSRARAATPLEVQIVETFEPEAFVAVRDQAHPAARGRRARSSPTTSRPKPNVLPNAITGARSARPRGPARPPAADDRPAPTRATTTTRSGPSACRAAASA